MRVYVGQTRSASLIDRLSALGFGEMSVREEVPPRRHPWALDNGVFRDWKAGRDFDAAAFSKSLDATKAHHAAPDFIVAPDIVGGGWASLNRSRDWIARLKAIAPLYLAVQDGMPFEVAREPGFDGIFVGGTLDWKISTGAGWVGAAHALGKQCHIGRVGTGKRVRWARRIGADSIDSCLPLFSEDNLRRFLAGFDDTQLDLFCEAIS